MFGKKKQVEEKIDNEQDNKYGYLDFLKEKYMNRLLFYHSVTADLPADFNDLIIVYYIHDIRKGDENNYDGTWKINIELVSARYDRKKKEFDYVSIDNGKDTDTIVGSQFFNRTFLPYVIDGETPYETFTKIKEKYQKIKDKITEKEKKKKEEENARIYSFLKIDDE